jgi:hypothetical protein
VRQTEELVRSLAAPAAAGAASRRAAADDAWDDLVEELYGVLEVPVRIRAGKRGGRVELRFRDRAELERLVERLRTLG